MNGHDTDRLIARALERAEKREQAAQDYVIAGDYKLAAAYVKAGTAARRLAKTLRDTCTCERCVGFAEGIAFLVSP